MVKLVIVRHGESVANQKNIFTGWSDVDLTNKGVDQAHIAGKLIKNTQIQFSEVHTSYLKRAILTANIVLDEIDQNYLPEFKTWRLNERHYGSLRGKNKLQVKTVVGEQQLKIWRRSYKVVPPLLDQRDHELRYDKVGVKIPLGESLEMAWQRVLPYWVDHIAPNLIDGHNQLIVAHGSTLRALIKYLDQVSDDQISQVEVPNAQPILYEFDQNLKILNKKLLK